MVMNLKSSAVICGVALFTAIFFVTELGARGLNGGGRGGGGGGFSRAGVASGAGFSARSGQRASQPMQRQDVAGTRKATPQGSREEGRGSQNQDTARIGQIPAGKIVSKRQRIDRKTGRISLLMNSMMIMIAGMMMTVSFWQAPLSAPQHRRLHRQPT
jgi:hypothetical protein